MIVIQGTLFDDSLVETLDNNYGGANDDILIGAWGSERLYRPGDTFPGKRPGDTFPGNRPGDTFPGNRPGDTFPGKRPGDTFPGKRPGDTFPGNQAPTNLILSNTSIAENSANGAMIAALSTVDPDAGDTHTYSLIDNAGGRFTLSGNQLSVANGSLLDFETAANHFIILQTTDSAGNTFDKPFTISVTDVNESPTDIALTGSSIDENSPNGTIIGVVSTSDLDAGDIHTYRLSDTAGGRFAIEGNQLIVANSSLLDYETATQHSTILRTTDTGGNSFEKAFTISISDVDETIPNNAPADIILTNLTLAENSANGTGVGDLTTVDRDAGDTHSYSLVDDAAGRFVLSGAQITVADSTLLDYEVNQTHPITVRTTDAGGLTFDKTFTLSVANLNETPTDIGVSNTVVDKNSSNGTAIGNITSTDPDMGDTHTYALVDNAGGRFGISGNQLTVADSTLLDYETATSHPIILRSTDAGGLSIDQNFVITLNNNINDPPVLVMNSPLSVTQRGIAGITNSLLQVTDPDNTPGQLTYTLVNAPTNGQLKLDSTPLFVNDTFTQADIDSNRLSYTHGLIQLTNRSITNSYPEISGSNVVWTGWDGTDYEIYFYDGTSTTQLTNNSIEDQNPRISGSNVVWSGYDGNDWEIYFYDGNSTTQLTNNSVEDYNPEISGSNVVWSGYDATGDLEIFFYDGNSTTQLTNNYINDFSAKISGSNVAWLSGARTDREIYFYDGNNTTQLTNNRTYDYAPQISGSNVVWTGDDEAEDGIDTEIYFYDGNSTTQLTNNNTADGAPQISGSNLVYSSWDGTDSEIYFYDGNSTTQLTNNSTGDSSPHISGSNVVWYGGDGTGREIYFHDGNSTTQVTNNNTYDSYFQISGSNVVWQGWDGTDTHIYFSPMARTLMSDSLMFTVSDGIGGVLGATSFNVNVI